MLERLKGPGNNGQEVPSLSVVEIMAEQENKRAAIIWTTLVMRGYEKRPYAYQPLIVTFL